MSGFLQYARRQWLGAGIAVAAVAGAATWAVAADHRDSAALTSDTRADIADVYVFRSPERPNNVVLALTVNGLIPPSENGQARFDPDVLYQFEIDNTGDAVEDLVIQAFASGGGTEQTMLFRGPGRPELTGTEARVLKGETVPVRVSRSGSAVVQERGGMRVFAGLRDDPFFFDLAQFRAILGGTAPGFRNPGVDAFAGTNVLAIAVEVPAAMLGGTRLNVWGTTHRVAD
jgi:hypothetical protein